MTLSQEAARSLPIFKVSMDGGTHPPVALDRPVCVIGRREGVNLPLDGPLVSKFHALVVRTQGRVYVRDLASRNGVQCNGEPVQEVGLSDEDELRIGSYTLRCSSGFGEAQATESASAPPAAELVSSDGQHFPFPVDRRTMLIGHREGCDVRLDDDAVAPVHAILFEMDGKRYVRDLGTSLHTRVNGQKVHQSTLNPGDEIRVGGVTLRYTPIDVTEPAGAEPAPSLDAMGISDSLTAPGIDLADSAADASAATGDSMIAPEITMEDSRTPAAPATAQRPASPISEYDMDVAEPDPRRESTFAGEVVDYPGRPPADASANTLTPAAGTGEAKSRPPRPEVPPEVPTSQGVGAAEDSAIPIAGSFHDQVLEDHQLQDLDDPHAESPGRAPEQMDPPPAVPTPAPSAADLPVPAAGTERVERVSEKVGIVAAKVDRVAAKTTGPGASDHPGTSEKTGKNRRIRGKKRNGEPHPPGEPRGTSAPEKAGDS